MFDDEFIENLPENNWEALELIRDRFRSWNSKIDYRKRSSHYHVYMNAYAFLNAFLEKVNFNGKMP